MNKITRYLIGSFFLLALLQGCDYNDYDNPPEEVGTDNITATHTIQQLKDMYTRGGTEVNSDVIVKGRVISSDKEGNIYKALMIQDETGGIEIKINSSGLYNYYRPGRVVYLHANSLKLGAYGGTVSIGTVPIDNNYENDFIPSPVVQNYVAKGLKESPVTPLLAAISSLRKQYSNTLVKIEGVQFLASELGLSYADGKENITQNRTLIDKNGNRLVVRTSGYARFAETKIAQGSGSITGILTYFNETAQLTIVKIDDVQLDKPRF